MLGAILGDIVGSPFEFDRGKKIKDFGPLFSDKSGFTDDTVMTVAVADALMNAGIDADVESIRKEVIKSMKDWGRRYLDSGFGSKFIWWLMLEDESPYGSWGNGSAMRVSAAGWLYDSLERTREVARATAEVTHNHPEGIKGAECTAAAIFMARTGKSKEEIKQYIIDEFGYDLSRTLDEIRPNYRHVESCQETVPEAVTAFLEGEDFEDVVRCAVSLGGDCDTLTCIAASMAEAFYGIPEEYRDDTIERIPEEMNEVYKRFTAKVKRINRNDLYVFEKESEVRQKILEYLEGLGFKLAGDEIKTRQEIINGSLPIIVEKKAREYHMHINTTTAACAAQCNQIITAEDLYKMHLEGKEDHSA